MSDVENQAGADIPESPEVPESSQVNDEAAEAGTENAADGDDKAPEPQEERKFTQAELDELLQKRLAKERARAERREREVYREALEAVTRGKQEQAPVVDNAPKREQFASEDEYIDAKVAHALSKREAAARQEQTQRAQQELTAKTEKLYAEAGKLPDFDQDVFDSLPMSQTMATAIIDSDVAPKLMAYMSANPDEAERIARLPAVRQAAELGKLELKLSAAPKTTKAPAPITPVGAKGSADSPLEKLSFDEYKKARQKQGARWAR